VEEVFLAIQEKVRGPAPKEQLIVLDGKESKHSSGASALSAVTVPSQHYLGSALVDQKTNEIPVARQLFNRLELEDRLVSQTPYIPRKKPPAHWSRNTGLISVEPTQLDATNWLHLNRDAPGALRARGLFKSCGLTRYLPTSQLL
jgi:hypothetical protein